MYYCILLGILFIDPSYAIAETLYRWIDTSNTVRYGYQPPLGVQAIPAEKEYEELTKDGVPVNCQKLMTEHLRLIDKEIADIKATPAGLGLDYELTPATKQELILDLLAHRSALITGRNASDFRLKNQYKLDQRLAQSSQEKMQLQKIVKKQEAIFKSQRNQIKRKQNRASYPFFGPYPIIIW
ncbi:hypothetical conserved protein [Candidatus Nitrosoglobus terrae]|uniref:Hypothetical conserved protein n=1 Tax=Candidatus Nitrosoglobus terrae TaxID=1630141 RepID=A0A1Q2SMP6_9GAMM|nr:hypothetical protein [Candidatus Nitrosoglobus terrae]BAW80369.1 hypothetical conserved protein [Candidatus Nitrosoglobus terrae]